MSHFTGEERGFHKYQDFAGPQRAALVWARPSALGPAILSETRDACWPGIPGRLAMSLKAPPGA